VGVDAVHRSHISVRQVRIPRLSFDVALLRPVNRLIKPDIVESTKFVVHKLLPNDFLEFDQGFSHSVFVSFTYLDICSASLVPG
jgi:hypothetical protein